MIYYTILIKIKCINNFENDEDEYFCMAFGNVIKRLDISNGDLSHTAKSFKLMQGLKRKSIIHFGWDLIVVLNSIFVMDCVCLCFWTIE